MTVIEKAPAKINLSLDVLRKRKTDEYHDVEMVMTTIDLADRLEFFSLEEDRIEIDMDNRYVPNDQRNLAYRAAKIFKDTFAVEKGVRIRIDKSIPVSAGLGGGSTDAAAVLRGLNRLWSLDLELSDLAPLAAKCGSDATFSLYGDCPRLWGNHRKTPLSTSLLGRLGKTGYRCLYKGHFPACRCGEIDTSE